MQVHGQVEQLSVLQQHLENYWDQEQLPKPLQAVFALALEELFINACVHGGGGVRPLVVDLEMGRDANQVTMALTDNAPAFDPTRVAAPDLDADLEARPVGGLGLHLVRQSMDRFEYQYADQRNRVLLSHKL